MKAAILYALGEAPRFGDYPEPEIKNDNQLILNVKAAAVKNIDKGIASGKHYSSSEKLTEPLLIGMEAVGTLDDGTRVYAAGRQGMIAEKALIDKDKFVRIPDQLDDLTAAALPNAVWGSAPTMLFRANLQPGETVLINGATGVTGIVAVQIAKYFGASKVIVTGRNSEMLNKLIEFGADEIISLKQDDEQILKDIRAIHHTSPIDIVIDYTWGHPAELILTALQGKGELTHQVRFVNVGSMAGEKIHLPSGILRSSDVLISGSGIGSLPKEVMGKLFSKILPEMFQLAADGKLIIETVSAPLQDVETAWAMDVPSGKRLVITI
jgi:NADPH:quinone reductase-like Zn-dependent oxidoreductase